MQLGKIDILINSASRLDCLIPTVNSLLNRMKYSEGYRLILHDDVVRKEGSRDIARWVEESKIIDVFIRTEPAMRLGVGIYKGLKEVRSPYLLKWEDDWLFLKDVYLDEILAAMEADRTINQVAFNKHRNEKSKHEITRPVRDMGSFKLTQIQEWSIGPGVWRTDFSRAKWPYAEDAHAALWVYGAVDLSKGQDYEWMRKNVGCYFYGGHGEGPFVEHLGHKSMWFAEVDVR